MLPGSPLRAPRRPHAAASAAEAAADHDAEHRIGLGCDAHLLLLDPWMGGCWWTWLADLAGAFLFGFDMG